MSLRSAIEHAANIKEQDDILYEELKYTLNQLQLGENEALAYEQLGQRLNLPVYVRLMNRLSQGLRMGSNDLLPVMENEVRLAFDKRLSFIKRKGEEVSTLLLFPMIILLLVVMFLIIAPAVIGY